MHLGKTLTAGDFEIRASGDSARVRVIGVVENQAPTRALEASLPIRDGVIEGQGETCQIALVERHRGTGGVVNGFVTGFGYPVVPEGTARIRAQMSAGLSDEQVDAAVAAFAEVLR